MRKKLLISLVGLLGFLFGGLLITSYVLAHKLKTLAKNRSDEPVMQVRGEISTPLPGKHKFKFNVCDYFPVTVFSDTPEDTSYGKSLCDVTYKKEKLALIFQPLYIQELLTIYDHPIMSNLKGLPNIQKIEMIFESKGPGDVKFLLSREQFQQAIFYLVNGMSRKFKSWDKYHHPKYMIYSWDVSRGSFKEQKVQLFTDTFSVTCMGVSCIEYLYRAEIL